MNKTLPFLIYYAFLLIGHTQCKSVIFNGTESLSNSNENIDSLKTFKDAVLVKFSNLSAEPIKLGLKLLQDTCEDDLDNEVKNILTRTFDHHRNISNESSVKKIQFFLRLSLAFDSYSGTIVSESGEKSFVLLMQEALQRHDVKSVAIEFQKTYDEFLKWLTLEIEANYTEFTSEEQLKVIRFKNLCKQFKEESDGRLYIVDRIVERL